MTMTLEQVAQAMVAPGRGILAADESSGTIKRRFDSINAESTADNRRDYREMLFRSTDAMKNHISGVILYDETLRQKAKDGTPLAKVIADAGSLPGIFIGSYFAIRVPERALRLILATTLFIVASRMVYDHATAASDMFTAFSRRAVE